MPQNPPSPLSSRSNLLLSALPEADFQLLSSHLIPRLFHMGQTLYQPGDSVQQVYFLKAGVISFVLVSENGIEVEVGMVGSEGAAGAGEALCECRATLRAVVQASGSGWVLAAPLFREVFSRSVSFQRVVLKHQQNLAMQSAQAVLCNRLHSVEQRLCRWLLVMQDRVQSNELELTHEYIAALLGMRRAGVTVAAGQLRDLGLIDYQRGIITILDRDGLEKHACECYAALHQRDERLLERYNEYSTTHSLGS